MSDIEDEISESLSGNKEFEDEIAEKDPEN